MDSISMFLLREMDLCGAVLHDRLTEECHMEVAPMNIPESMVFLPRHNKRIYSQNGEDGILLAIFDKIGFTNKRYLEFGATPKYNNGQILDAKHGCSGILWNGSFMNCDYSEIHEEFVTVENIHELCQKYEVPAEPDMVSIDIDGNDWHVWRELDKVCHPRVVIIEHLGQFGAKEDKVMPYDPTHVWDGSCYAGASMYALFLLGRKLGYSLVCSDSMGVNLFFVRDDLSPETKFFGTNNPNLLYRLPKYGFPYRIGHPEDSQERPWQSAAELLNK